jgi:hypothetical protein
MNEIPSLLNKNLQLLEKTQPRLASRLRRHLDELPSIKEPQFRETASGRWVSGLTEHPFFEKKPTLEKRRKTASSAVYLVFGAGCAPYLFHLLRSLPREALSVTVFEPSLDLLLHTLAQTSVFQALPPGCRISFIVDEERFLIDEAFAWNITPIGIFPVGNAVSIAHDGEAEAVGFQPLESLFKKEIIYRLTLLGNSPEDTLLGLRHAALNTPRILRSPRVGELAKLYSGKPFVCVATGPSLEKNVHLLKEIRDKCVLIACDTSLHRLLDMGVKPHVVTTIERPYTSYISWLPDVLKSFPEACEDIVLLSQSVSYPLIAGRWPGPNIIIGKLDVPVDNWYTGALLGEQMMYSGLSVSHMALSFSIACGASTVALIGQDLAYSEEGRSHAADTVPDSALALEQERRRTGVSVPGALGGEVVTSTIWLTFIQMFERLIGANMGVPVYDCTEGGALIKGTRVIPLREYIDHQILSADVSVSRWRKTGTGKQIPFKDVLERFEKAFAQLDRIDERLNEMRSRIARCTAPALMPAKRQEIAFSVAGILDDLHAMNPVISFIGQSYTHLSGAVLAENRFLETVEQVRRWKELHEEIVESHSYAVAFLRQWLGYARELTERIFTGEIREFMTLSGNGEAEFLELFDSWSENPGSENQQSMTLQLSELLSCKDPLRQEWTPGAFWKAAFFLFQQGRAEEGRRFMQRAYEMLEQKVLPISEIGLFFKDWGKMAAADDLCVQPLVAEAMTYFANAREYLPEDEEILLLQQKTLDRQKKVLKESAKTFLNQGNQVRLLLLRNTAETALLDQDLPTALQCIEKLVWESLEDFPGTALPHLRWLMKTAASCLDAADKRIAELSAEILDGIVSRLPGLIEKKIEFPVEFLRFMEQKGVKFALDTSDKQTSAE